MLQAIFFNSSGPFYQVPWSSGHTVTRWLTTTLYWRKWKHFTIRNVRQESIFCIRGNSDSHTCDAAKSFLASGKVASVNHLPSACDPLISKAQEHGVWKEIEVQMFSWHCHLSVPPYKENYLSAFCDWLECNKNVFQCKIFFLLFPNPTKKLFAWPSYRVKSGIFGQTAKFGQPPCLFHSSIIGIKINYLSKQ